MDKKDILSRVDHTLLSQTATWEEIRQILDDGINNVFCCIFDLKVVNKKIHTFILCITT